MIEKIKNLDIAEFGNDQISKRYLRQREEKGKGPQGDNSLNRKHEHLRIMWEQLS